MDLDRDIIEFAPYCDVFLIGTSMLFGSSSVIVVVIISFQTVFSRALGKSSFS